MKAFLALSCMAAVSLAGAAAAAPVTLAFEAEITTVFPGIPFDSGVEFSEGDGISGLFTFEPTKGDGSMLFETSQPYPFVLNIGGVGFSTPSFEIDAVNNSAITDFDAANVIDVLELGAGGLIPFQSDEFPNIDAASSSFRMTLFGPATAIPQADVPGAVLTWNEFDLSRVVLVSLRDGFGGVVAFQATVQSFRAIPVPPSLHLMLIAVVLVASSRFLKPSA